MTNTNFKVLVTYYLLLIDFTMIECSTSAVWVPPCSMIGVQDCEGCL